MAKQQGSHALTPAPLLFCEFSQPCSLTCHSPHDRLCGCEMIVAIGGCSGSGKSTLARLLLEKYSGAYGESATLVSADDHCTEPWIPLVSSPFAHYGRHVELNYNFELPDSVDWPAVRKSVSDARANSQRKCIIVEGHLIFADPQLVPLFDKCILFTSDSPSTKELLKMRRWERDYRTSEVTFEDFTLYWDSIVWPHHLQHGLAHPHSCLKLDPALSTATALKLTLQYLQQ